MKAVRTAALVIGAAALVATGVGAAVGAGLIAASAIGASAATLTAIGAGLSAASGILSIAAGAAAPKGSVGGNATKFKIDKEAGIPVAFGRTYVGGNVVHRQYYNRPGDKLKNQLESWVTILSLGLVQSVGPLLIDKTPVAFDAGGQALGTYRGNMWLDTQRGACPEGRALAAPFGAFPGWDGSSRLSGLAADLWTLDFDSKGEKFPNGVPERGRVLEGVLVYDPRQDSTYPGGNGPCRLGQPATYVYSENPGPHAITWAYGHYQNGVLVAGGGLSAGGIDMAPYVEWSNVCDANGWKVGVVYVTTDDAWDVLKMICQAGSATPLPVGAQLSVTFSAPRVSIGTISSADISGDVDVPATVARRTRRNTLIPSVRLESHGWEMVPLDPVSVPAYVAIDGGRRPREVTYPLVQNARQGAQLALYEMLNDRELSGIVVPAKVYALGYRPGDCITLQIPEANLIGREVVIGQRELDVATNGVTLVCRSEDNSKHAFALGKTTTPPPTPDLSNPGVDRTAPDATDWAAAGTTLSANGVDVPAIVITSLVDRIAADEIVFDYRPRIPGASPDVNWTGASIEPSSVLRKEITSVTPNTAYDVGVRYRIRGAVSARLIIENVTVGNAALPWANVSDPDGTRPDPNATNSADPNSPFGPNGQTVGDAQRAIDAAKAQQEQLTTVTIPAVEKAVADAGERITAARGRADAAYDRAGQAIEDADTVNRRVDTLIAEGGGGSEGVDSVARAEIKRVDEAAMSRDDAVARSVESLSASYTSGGNLLSNTDFAVDAAGWVFDSEQGSLADRNGQSPAAYWPARMNALVIYQPNGAVQRSGYWYQDVLGLEPGATYQAAAYIATHRCPAGLYLDIFGAGPGVIGTFTAEMVGQGNAGSGNLTDYQRVVCTFVAPPGAVWVRFFLMKYGTNAGEANSYAWFLRPQLAKVRAGVTGAVPYTPGSGDAGRIATDARVGREVVALAEADAALARESVAIEARLGERVSASARDVTTAFTEADRALGSRSAVLEASAVAARAGSLISNDTFSYWPDPAYLPPQWSAWNQNPEYFTRYQTPHSSGGYAFRARAPLDYQCGIAQYGCRFEAGWYVMEADAELLDGDWTGGGLTIEGAVNLDFAREADTNGIIGSAGFRRRRWSKLIYLDRAWNNWHLMMNWGPFAPLNYKFVDWYHCGVRPASDAEIAARKAIDVTIPAVSARVKTAEDTLADLPNRYAAAERTAALEAQVNFATDSGLQRTINARIEDRATAIANGAAGGVATTLQQLRTEYNGAYGQLQQVAGSVTGIDGRSEVYWRVTGTTNDGATQISLTKKDGTSPLFYIGANTLIDGNLMVTGTVTSRTIQNGSITNSLTTTGGTYGFQQNTVADTGTLSISIAGTGYVRIDVRLSTNYVDGESGMTAPNMWFLALYCEQNGQQRLVGSTPFREGPYFSFWENDVPSAGIARYFVRITLSVAQRNGTVFNTKINATEYKK